MISSRFLLPRAYRRGGRDRVEFKTTFAQRKLGDGFLPRNAGVRWKEKNHEILQDMAKELTTPMGALLPYDPLESCHSGIF